jgi:hypothetical protein
MIKLPDTFTDPDEHEFEYKLSKTILGMPAEVQDRFKALKVLNVTTLYALFLIRMRKESLTMKRRLSIENLSSSMINFTRRSMNRETSFLRES